MRMNGAAGTDIHARLGSLADSNRTRLLLLLSRHERSVNELCAAVQLPQSTVSRHLKVLGDEGWVVSRAEGPSRFYRLAPRLDRGARRLWSLVRQEVTLDAEAAQDEERAKQAIAHRRTKSREFFSGAAGEWDALREEMLGARAGLSGLLALVDPGWVIGDLGCGTGAVAAELAPYVRGVVAV
ncbi:MAG: metalloregulator ArsR/SmtB family transcription factor, partial [Rhodococcus ruber]|nr:metalloregulator ArsR/SmtB family transcription factor [Rhodococcus ruber]